MKNQYTKVQSFQFHTKDVRAIKAVGDKLYTAAIDRKAAMWDIRTGELLCRFTGHEDYINDLCVEDGMLYTGSHDTSIVSWNLQLLLAQNFFSPCCDIDYLTHYDHNDTDLKVEDPCGRNVLLYLGSYGSLECINTVMNDFSFSLEKKNSLGER